LTHTTRWASRANRAISAARRRQGPVRQVGLLVETRAQLGRGAGRTTRRS
jgi:hypothetical protein